MDPEHRNPEHVVRNLREADFGSRFENVLRYGMIVGLGLLIWYRLDLDLVLVWITAYASTEVVYFWTVSRADARTTRMQAAVAFGAYVLTTVTFMSLPMYLTHDPRQLVSVAALFTQLGLLIYFIWRQHRMLWVVMVDLLLILALAANLIFAFWGEFSLLWERLFFGILTLGLSAYAMMAILRSLRQEREFRQAADRLRENDRKETIAQLTGGVAHDFNNILTVVLGNLELYQLASTDAEREELVREASEAADHGAHLISQLLAYSRRVPMAPETGLVKEHIAAAKPLLERMLPESITLDIAVDGDAGHISVDRAQFTAALLNLMSNAADAIGAQQGRVLISGWRLRGPFDQQEVVIAVSDTGGGLSEDIADRVLEPYFTTKGAAEGSGLGLAMVKGFAEQSGGRLELHNRPRDGLTVAIVLPRAPVPSAGQHAPGTPVEACRAQATGGRSGGAATPATPGDLPT